jgi:hypothetical protein
MSPAWSKLELLLAESLRVAHETGALRTRDLKRVTVDTTVQPKAITFPTDAKLLHAAIKGLNRLARKHGVRQWKDVPRGTMDEVSSHVCLNLPFKLTTAVVSAHRWRCGRDSPCRHRRVRWRGSSAFHKLDRPITPSYLLTPAE